MSLLDFPWLEVAIGLTWTGLVVTRVAARPVMWTALLCIMALGCVSIECWLHHADMIHLEERRISDWLEVDILTAPVLPLVALVHLLVTLMVPRIQATRQFCSSVCVSLGLQLATFGCTNDGLLVLLLIAGIIPPLFEHWLKEGALRVFLLHQIPYGVLLLLGLLAKNGEMEGITLVFWMIAALLRSGTFPAHGWVNSLVQHANFGSAILYVVPMIGFYATLRLVLPLDPSETMLQVVEAFSIFTALLASGLAVIQQDARKMYSRLVLSHSSMLFIGLELLTPLSLTGSLAQWLSATISLCGLGLVLWGLEARYGNLDLSRHRGLYATSPVMGAFLLLMGLASVGFPGTIGFASSELLIDGAVTDNLLAGLAIVLASLLNGIAIMRMYFLLFTGKQHFSLVPLGVTWKERLAIGLISLVIFGTGLAPETVLTSRHRAAHLIVDQLEKEEHSNSANGQPQNPKTTHSKHDD